MVMVEILRLCAALGAAYLAGKLAARIGLPAILGWLLTGMALGPHGFNLLNQQVMDAGWYQAAESMLECIVGLMIGTELIWSKMKKAGRQIVVTTLTESLGTFVVVGAVFSVIFAWQGVPVYLAWILGGIALATAPAPSLSIVASMRTSGPVTRTLIPMAALDDLVGALVFFIVVAFVSANISAREIPVPVIMFLVFLPVFIGAAGGWAAGKMLRRCSTRRRLVGVMLVWMAALTAAAWYLNEKILPTPVLNFMLLGMAFSAAFANMVSQEQLDSIMKVMNPVIGLGLMVVILGMGAPLDYHLIVGAGVYTAVYILSRAAGKYSGAYLGGVVTHSPDPVKKYLGFTLLPHSGVSLLFTGIAVSVLEGPAPQCASIVQGTIVAAAVINELIAVWVAKKGFEWAGELNKAEEVSPI